MILRIWIALYCRSCLRFWQLVLYDIPWHLCSFQRRYRILPNVNKVKLNIKNVNISKNWHVNLCEIRNLMLWLRSFVFFIETVKSMSNTMINKFYAWENLSIAEYILFVYFIEFYKVYNLLFSFVWQSLGNS